MAEAGSVTALLKLDASGFDSGIRSSIDKVNDFVTVMERMSKDTSNFSQGLKNTITEISKFNQELTELNKLGDFQGFQRMANGLSKIVDTAIRFNQEGRLTVDTFRILGNSISAFVNALGGVEVKLTNVVRATEQLNASTSQTKLSTYSAEAEFVRLNNTMMNAANNIQRMRQGVQTTSEALASSKTNLSGFNTTLNTTHTHISTATTDYSNLISTVNRGNAAFTQAYEELMMLARGVEKFNAISATSNKLPTVTFAKELNNGAEELTKSMDKVSTSTDKASNSARNAQGSFRGLSNVLSTLKGIGMMVVSMFAYNFLHSLGQAVSETIKARSEMYSMFETMGMTTSQINTFNSALDQTVSKFQRVNKYRIEDRKSVV